MPKPHTSPQSAAFLLPLLTIRPRPIPSLPPSCLTTVWRCCLDWRAVACGTCGASVCGLCACSSQEYCNRHELHLQADYEAINELDLIKAKEVAVVDTQGKGQASGVLRLDVQAGVVVGKGVSNCMSAAGC